MPIRKNLAASRDPYRPWGGLKKDSQCRSCGAIYRNKSWFLTSYLSEKQGKIESPRLVLCPACQKIRDHFSAGTIVLRGSFLAEHKDEILQRIQNESARAKRVNPLERIISIKETEDRVEILTTSERFAQRIGREIQRAFKGRTVYHWPKEDKQIRVEWSRAE